MRRSIPSTQSLLCFEAAARHMSYTRAAQELALTQSAVSRQVAALEEYLGHRLFARTRYGLAMTPRGQAYARQVAERLGALERDTLDAMTGAGTQGAVQLAAVLDASRESRPASAGCGSGFAGILRGICAGAGELLDFLGKSGADSRT